MLTYWMVSGEMPYRRQDLGRNLRGGWPAPPSLHGVDAGHLDPFFRLALSGDPGERPSSGAEFRRLLEQARSERRGAPAVSGRGEGGDRTQKRRRRTRRGRRPLVDTAGNEGLPSPSEAMGGRRPRLPERDPRVGKDPRGGSLPDPGPASAAEVLSTRPSFLQGVLLGVGLGLLGTLALLGLSRERSGPGPLPREPVGPEVAGLTRDQLEELGPGCRQRLSDLGGTLVDLGGRTLPAGTQVGPGVWDLTGGDPLIWPRLVAALPELGTFYRWLEEGGRPEDLPVVVRQPLLDSDRFFRRQGLAAPFGPYLGLAPVPSGTPLPGNLRELFRVEFPDLELPQYLGGWAGRALAELALCEQGLGRQEAVLREHPEQLPGEIGEFFHQRREILGADLRDLVVASFPVRLARTRLRNWLGAEVEALVRGLRATGRSLEEEPEHGPLLSLLVTRFLDRRGRSLIQSEHFLDPLERFLGLPRGYRQGWALMGASILAEQGLAIATIQEFEADRRTREDLRRRLLEEVARGPRDGLAEVVWLRAQGHRIREARELGDLLRVVSLFQECSTPGNPASGQVWRWIRYQVMGLLGKGEEGLLPPSELRRVAHPPGHLAPRDDYGRRVEEEIAAAVRPLLGG